MLIGLTLAACAPAAPSTVYATTAPNMPLPDSIPDLPFSDNPDPSLCGIPQPYGNSASGLVTGIYNGKLVHPVIYLYESHTRQKITGQVYPNTRVHIKLSQSNPELDYFFVETIDLEQKQSGWLPAPFLLTPDPLEESSPP